MEGSRHHWRGVSNYIRDRGPLFALAYGGIVLCLLVIGVSILRQWPGYVPLALAATLVLGYFLAGAFWTAYQIAGRPGQRPVERLLEIGRLRPDEWVVCVDLGLRETALVVAGRLTVGRVTVIDVYNPQWNTSATLRRGRLRVLAHHPPADPRVEWLDGETRLLPLPNESVSAVFLNQVLSEFWQLEDRLLLLREVFRILRPNGRLLLAERVRSRTNWLVLGPWGWQLAKAEDWRALLAQVGFALPQETDVQDLVHCFRADKPLPAAALQLALHLDLE
jgi:SAM-dependent methyltransferase